MRPGISAEADLCASLLVRRFAIKIAAASGGKPVLDVGCGSGRNAIFLSLKGCDVICLDKSLDGLVAHQERLSHSSLRAASARLRLQHLDLIKDPWPFADDALGAIISIHFLLPALFPYFAKSLTAGGYLLLQTVPGCGGNHHELPRAGELRTKLEHDFDLEFYRERPVGPRGCGAVTVQAAAKWRTSIE